MSSAPRPSCSTGIVRLNVAGYIMDRNEQPGRFQPGDAAPRAHPRRNTLETINAPGTTKIRGVERRRRLLKVWRRA